MKKMISRRNFLAAAGVVAAAGVLTACGGSSNSTAASASTAASGAATSGDTIKVGVLGPLTGDVSVYGQAVVNGATLYLKQVNEKGGVNGKQLEAVTMDEQGDETQAVTCFTKMVDQGITALVGDVTTAPTLAVAAESAEYNVPMVTASATAETVTYDAETDTVNENVFRACFTDPFQGVKMADYAYEKLGYTKAAVIFLKGKDYNEGLAENFAKEFEAKGGTIVDQESYSEGDVDFKTQLTSILGKNPEVVFCPNYYQDVGQILAQAESVGLTVPFLGGDGWDGLEGYATNDQLKALDGLADYSEEPVSTDTQHVQPVDNYGSAFAPYFMSLSMWVGGLMIFFGIYLDYQKKIRILSKDSDHVVLRAFVFMLLGLLQAVLLAFVIHHALGIKVANLGMLYLSCCLVSLTFISIIQFCLVHLGDAGKFVALLLLILQLTSCAGTFPIETCPTFFQKLYPFMPMTYSVRLFKEALAGTWNGSVTKDVLILVAIMVVFTLATTLLSAYRDRHKIKEMMANGPEAVLKK